MMIAVDYDSDGYDWPDTKLGKQLTSLEDTLLCPICQGLFNNPQVLNCGHSFCSLCIRKHFDKTLNMTTSDVCPACREKAESLDLKVNRSLASFVSSFKAMRKDLMNVVTSSDKCGVIDDVVVAKQKKDRSNIVVERIAHFNFHGMSKDKVKKTIEGVLKNTKNKLKYDGDKDALEKRFRELVHLNNAQIGSSHPLSLDEIIKIVNDKDALKEIEAKKSQKSLSKLEKLKNGEQVHELESSFNALAKKALEHKNKSKAKAPPSSTQHDNNVEVLCEDLVSPICTQDTSVFDDAIPIFDPRSLANTFDKLENPSMWGNWRVIINSKDGRPFYFDVENRVGQFDMPVELMRSVTSLRSVVTSDEPSIVEPKRVLKAPTPSPIKPSSADKKSDIKSSNTLEDDEASVDVTDLFPESQVYSSLQPTASVHSLMYSASPQASGKQKSSQPNTTTDASDTQQSQQTTQWTCPVCTFTNEVSCRTCEMCDTPNTSFVNMRQKRMLQTQSKSDVTTTTSKSNKKAKN